MFPVYTTILLICALFVFWWWLQPREYSWQAKNETFDTYDAYGECRRSGQCRSSGACRRETDRHGGGYRMEPHSRDGHMFTPTEYPCKAPCVDATGRPVADYTRYPVGYPRNLREMGPREWFREPEPQPWTSWWQWLPRGQNDRDIFKFGYGID